MTTHSKPPPDQLEEVFSSVDVTQVEIARDLLQGSGLDCFIFDADSSRMLGSTAAITARLMVHTDAATEARRRLKELGFET
jgi:hypothetical protein